MKKISLLTICITAIILLFSFTTYADTESVHIGSTIFTYDNEGNVIMNDTYREDFEEFLNYVGEEYTVVSITLTDNIYYIRDEVFTSVSETLKELIFTTSPYEIGYNIFGESHNVKIKYDGSEKQWNNIQKQNEEDYFKNIEFYCNGYAKISSVDADAYMDKLYISMYLSFAEKDCVAQFEVYSYNSNNEKETELTFTKKIEANTGYLKLEKDFVSDGKNHYINVILYDDLTNKVQWGGNYETSFFAYNDSLIHNYISVYDKFPNITLQIGFKYVKKDCVAYVEIFDYDENGELVPNKSLIIDILANTTDFSYDIPFDYDNKEHFMKVSFYDDKALTNEVDLYSTYNFSAMKYYNGFIFDNIDEKTAKIISLTEYFNPLELELPHKIGELTPTEIAENAFANNTYFAAVLLPSSYTKIGKGAFSNCTGLTEVYYTGSEEEWNNITIEENNEYLKNANITYNYTPKIYANWNYNYDNGELYVYAGITNLFNECTAKIDLVNISKGETETIYFNSTEVENGVKIPLTNYDETFLIYGSLLDNDKTTFYTVPDNFAFFTPYEDLPYVEEGDFVYVVNKNNEAEIYRYIGTSENIIIPDTIGGCPVTTLMGWSISNDNVKELTIGKNLKKISYGALAYCMNLKNIIVNPQNEYFTFEDGVLYNKDKTELVAYLLTNEREYFKIPDSVTDIGAHSFEATEYLKTVELSKNTKRIERQAFAYSTISGELVLPEGLEFIGSEALCADFSKIYIPKSVNNIFFDAVGYTMNLKEITVDEKNEYYASIDGVLYNKSLTKLIEYPEQKNNKSFIIPDTVTEIGEGAFIGAESLEKIVFPKSLKIIGNSALRYTNVTTVFYQGTKQEYGSIATDWYCPNIIFGESTYLTDNYFKYEITLDKTEIIDVVDSFDYVFIPETINYIQVDSIAPGVLDKLSNLKVIEADENSKHFKTDNEGVLYNKSKTVLLKYPCCKVEEEFIIPSTVKEIAKEAFANASSLKSVTLPSGLNAIGENAFSGCTELNNIYFKGTEENFDNINIHSSNTMFTKENVEFINPAIKIVSQSQNNIIFKGQYIKAPSVLIIAYYNNGELVKLEEKAYSPDEEETITLDKTFDYENDTIKIMVWEDFSTMKDLCAPLKIGK